MDFIQMIRAILAKTDGNQADLARTLGVSQPTVSRWLDARKPAQPQIPVYLAARDLAIRLGIISHETGATLIPILSWVAAGAMTTPDAVQSQMDAPTIAIAGLDPTGVWIALKVDGTSMDRISPPGSIVIANIKDRRLVPNACYIISDADTGEATYKRYRPNPDRWEPVSTFPNHEPIYVTDGMPAKVIARVRRSIIDL
jgi:SOS-response transcriptional repressor LexA